MLIVLNLPVAPKASRGCADHRFVAVTARRHRPLPPQCHLEIRMAETPETPKDFEAALAELESIVATMESGQLPLADSLAAYKRGRRTVTREPVRLPALDRVDPGPCLRIGCDRRAQPRHLLRRLLQPLCVIHEHGVCRSPHAAPSGRSTIDPL